MKRQVRDSGSKADSARLAREIHAGSAFISAEWIGLIVPIEIARIRADGTISVLRGLVIGEEAVRIYIKAAGSGIIPYAGEKTRHAFVFLLSLASISLR